MFYNKTWKEEDLENYLASTGESAWGYWSDSEWKYTVNYSGILTRLIQEAGRWCERYASDLFIDWMTIEEELGSDTFKGKTCYFGFRKDGVDSLNFILGRMNDGGRREEYRAIWRLEIKVDEDSKLTMELRKVLI